MRQAGLALAGVAALAVAASAAPAAWAARESAVGATTHLVEIRGFAFSPAVLEVAPGDTVVWVNRDLVPHTATDTAEVWDSGELGAGEQWSWVPREAGEFGYDCTYHPIMRGTIVVREGS